MISLVARGIASLAGRMATRNPQLGKNILSLLRKKPKGITVYRGDIVRNKYALSKSEIGKMYNPTGTGLTDFSNPNLRKLAMGRWFAKDPKTAMGFAGKSRFLSMFKNPKDVLSWGGGYQPGLVKKLTLSAKEAKLSNRLMNKLHNTKDLNYAHVVSKEALKRAETDKLRTFIANFYRMIGKKKGGLAQVLNV
tara:strand:+ start:305 stop:883 length:579 start_codon:yes stop_codon:yes gene_type:complete